MTKSFRNIAFAAVLAVVAVPSLHADRTGCNPHPQAVATTFTPMATLVLSVLSSLTL